MIRRPLALLALLALPLGLAACGEKSESTAAPRVERVTVLLDWLPNADHAPIYAAQASGAFAAAGLDVRLQTPSDAASPLKVLAAGKADLAITYEPELLLSRDKGQRLVAVGALVQQPLSSIISLDGKVREPADLDGKTVGVTGLPSDEAALRAVLAEAGLARESVKAVNVGFNLVPSLLSKRADAVLGAYWNVEGVELARQKRKPTIIKLDEAGVPTYDELVFVAREDYVGDHGELVRRFMRALAQGAKVVDADPAAAVDALVAANRDLDRGDQLAMVKATLPAFQPPAGKPFGWMDPAEWAAYGAWMLDNDLVERPTGDGAQTNEFLPGEGALTDDDFGTTG